MPSLLIMFILLVGWAFPNISKADEPTYRCISCHDTGRCTFCHGSGLSGMMTYDGQMFPCSFCHGTGICSICFGASVMVPPTSPSPPGGYVPPEPNPKDSPQVPKVCGFCHGTGVNPNPSYAPEYGTAQGEKWCEICGRKVRESHYHNKCPMCHGKGTK